MLLIISAQYEVHPCFKAKMFMENYFAIIFLL